MGERIIIRNPAREPYESPLERGKRPFMEAEKALNNRKYLP
jgi:hypothetical protein